MAKYKNDFLCEEDLYRLVEAAGCVLDINASGVFRKSRLHVDFTIIAGSIEQPTRDQVASFSASRGYVPHHKISTIRYIPRKLVEAALQQIAPSP